MGTHVINVFGEECQVEVVRDKKTVWLAYGRCGGRPIQQKGRSETGAIRMWQWIAERLNDYG